MSSRLIAVLVIASLAVVHRSSAAAPTSAPTTAPALTERQASVLMQLSNAEANIKAINKALVRTGYKVGLAYEQKEGAEKANELMDRKGGGPVPWDQFYGKTAMGFYYHASADLHYDAGRGAKTIDANWQGSRLTKVDRPKQFDAIYHANDQQAARAQQQIASLERDQAALLARRHQHEADQSRLWAVLAWEQVRDREIAYRPLYRFALQPADDVHTNLLRGSILYLRTADKALADALDTIDADQDATFGDLQQRTKLAYAALQQSLADALYAPQLSPDDRAEGEALKALCKQATDECTVIDDNYRKAVESDAAKEDASKLAYRSELQASVAKLAVTLQALDERLTQTGERWHVTATTGTESPDKLPTWPPHVVRPTVTAATPRPQTAPAVGDAAARTIPLLDGLSAENACVMERADDVVRISVRNRKDGGRAFSEAEFSPPLVITAVAKTTAQNLRLFYGQNGVIIFNWERGERRFRFEDPRTGRVSEIGDQGKIPADTFVTVRWVIGVGESRVDVDGVERAVFKGNYAGLSGRIGIGTHGPDTLTVRSLTVTPGLPSATSAPSTPLPPPAAPVATGERDPREVSLLDRLNPGGNAHVEWSDGLLKISPKDLKEECRATSAAHFAPPLVITAVAKTSDRNIRIFYGPKGRLIFNWEVEGPSLRHFDPETGQHSGVAGKGKVPVDRFVTIRWTITADESRVEVDGVERAVFKGDYANLSGGVAVGTHDDNTVTVRSLTVTPLSPTEARPSR